MPGTAMVLAAGFGERMRPLSLLRAKPALPVLNRPLIVWTLERLQRAGVRDVVINLHHLPRSVEAVVGHGGAFGLRVRYSRERTILGTGGGLRQARRLLGEAPVLVVNGDVLFDFDLRALRRRHSAARALATLALKPNPDPRRYSPVVADRDGRLRSLPPLPRATGPASLFTGVHVVEPGFLERLPRGASDSVRDLYAPALRDGVRLAGIRVRGAWHDLGSPRLYLDAQLRLLRRPPAGARPVSREARIDGRVVRCVVGPDARVYSGARLRECVVWEGAEVGADARLRRCIVATGARVAPGTRATERIFVPTGARRGGRRTTEVVPL